jgi:hypothetical protein
MIYVPMSLYLLGGGWRKASRSVNNGQCAEVASTRSAVLVRDSDNPSGLVVSYPVRAWQDFLARTKTGKFDALR